MNETSKKYGYEAYDIVKYAAHEIGGRLPGSDNEHRFHDYMAQKLEDIGIKPIKEEFTVAPRASIGGIPYCGYVGIVMSALTYVALSIPSLWVGMAFFSFATIAWFILSVLMYKTWFDLFFHQEISRNTYGELLPEDGEYDYTIILSAHTDTSWTWKHSLRAYRYRNNPMYGLLATIGKVGFGAVCFFFITLTSIFMAIVYGGDLFGAGWADSVIHSAHFIRFTQSLYFLPAVTALGCCFVVAWNDRHNRNASRGAMDNATGIALSYEVTKYYKEHPEKMPKRCRIIDFNCGSEEAGLRGAIAFTRHHKGEDILKNAWNINIDSVADKDYFEVINGDAQQFCHFDKDLEKMFVDTFKEKGIVSKTKGYAMKNPVGGCDSTPMTHAGIKSVTFAAQNPTLTYYYHTWRDLPERFSPDTVAQGFDVVISVIDKIAAFQEQNGYNGVNN
ncbi:MAG: M28 family peptidase [Clostridia bacterium]|nr:M28 family peptidase [Clostridia bacterium]